VELGDPRVDLLAVEGAGVEQAVAGVEAVHAVWLLAAHEYRGAVLDRQREHAALAVGRVLELVADGLGQELFGAEAGVGPAGGLRPAGRQRRHQLVRPHRLAAVDALAALVRALPPLVLDDPVDRRRRSGGQRRVTRPGGRAGVGNLHLA